MAFTELHREQVFTDERMEKVGLGDMTWSVVPEESERRQRTSGVCCSRTAEQNSRRSKESKWKNGEKMASQNSGPYSTKKNFSRGI